eukprot:GHVP01058307.1.p1 GENE.GHVP01058307.1~~GHVP01058307.1.p1  ORF type:complete len:597 (-),score=78.59 GHVP01058307.1:93-1883(-)
MAGWSDLPDSVWCSVFGVFLKLSLPEECVYRRVCKKWKSVLESAHYTRHIDLYLDQMQLYDLHRLKQNPGPQFRQAFSRIASHRGNLHIRTRLFALNEVHKTPRLDKVSLDVLPKVLFCSHSLRGFSWHDVSLASGVDVGYLDSQEHPSTETLQFNVCNELDPFTFQQVKNLWLRVWMLLQKVLQRSRNHLSSVSLQGKIFEVSVTGTQGVSSLFYNIRLPEVRSLSLPAFVVIRLELPKLTHLKLLKSWNFSSFLRYLRRQLPELTSLNINVDEEEYLPGTDIAFANDRPTENAQNAPEISNLVLRITRGDPFLNILDDLKFCRLEKFHFFKICPDASSGDQEILSSLQKLTSFLNLFRNSLKSLDLEFRSSDRFTKRLSKMASFALFDFPKLEEIRIAATWFFYLFASGEYFTNLTKLIITRWGCSLSTSFPTKVLKKSQRIPNLKILSFPWIHGQLPEHNKLEVLRIFPGVFRQIDLNTLHFEWLPQLRCLHAPFPVVKSMLSAILLVAPKLSYVNVASILENDTEEVAPDTLKYPKNSSLCVLQSRRPTTKHVALGLPFETKKHGSYFYSKDPILQDQDWKKQLDPFQIMEN